MLHDDILGDAFRTPFGSLLEMEGVKDSKGRLFGSCGWERVAPIWRAASEAVVERSSQELGVRVLLKKALVGKGQTLTETAFFRFELVGLARHPPKGGMKILNAHESVKCRHVMPLIRAKIEEVGSAHDWESVQSFCCVDIPELPQKGQAKALDSQASQFPKPWSDLDPECKVTNQALTRPLFHECLSKGQVAWRDLSELSRAEQIKGLDGTLQQHGPQVAVVLPDLVLMFPGRMLEDFVNRRMTSHSSDQHVQKAWELLSDWDWTGEPDLPTLRLLLSAPRDETRLKAVQALGVLSRQPSDLPSVQTCLWMAMSDSSQEVRGAVAQTFVNLTSPDKNDKTRLELVLETVKKVLREDAESIWRGSKSKLILESGIADERAVATAVMVLEGLAYQHFGAVLPILKHAATSGKLRTRLRIVKAAATLCANDRTRKGALLPLLQNAAADVAPGVSLDARNALLFSCPPNL